MKDPADIKIKVPLPKLRIAEKRQRIREWFSTPSSERVPPTEKELRELLKVKRREVVACREKMLDEKRDQQRRLNKARVASNLLGDLLSEKKKEVFNEVLEEDDGSDDVTKVLNALRHMATVGHSAFAAKVWLQAKGEFVERKDITNRAELSADDYFRIKREAEQRVRELTGERDRNTRLLQQSTVLPVEVRDDSG